MTDKSIPRSLLELQDVCREFPAGEETVAVLKNVDLQIFAGEFVAIVGASGSGKSTLMNILGCLDRPSSGVYRVAGKETGKLEPDDLARLRREHFGFIFQRYHLLSDLNAAGNVEMPAVYAGTPGSARHERAKALLARLGLSERVDYKPGQLSGGQQQRVSIARALMNGGDVILADEPTGALDTHSGQEVMRILEELNEEGHTIIIVTHDMAVAKHARRIIEISDGAIIRDAPQDLFPQTIAPNPPCLPERAPRRNAVLAFCGRTYEAFCMAVRAMGAHRLRTCLTMLGIIIGIASVVSVVALGEGSRQQILERLSAMGTNTLEIGVTSARNGLLTPAYMSAFEQEDYVDSLSAWTLTTVELRYRKAKIRADINGVSPDFFRVRGLELLAGSTFNDAAVREQVPVVVIDLDARNELFAPHEDPIGQIILLGKVPARVIGVAPSARHPFINPGGTRTQVWIPYTTEMYRLSGRRFLVGIILRVVDEVSMLDAEHHVHEVMTRLRGGRQDFRILNSDTVRQTVESTNQTLTILILTIAVIALIVGGIGVMNIMLVSVTERTREIGVRMAVGARQSDILTQFLIEAVLVCLIGGALGIALALALGEVLPLFSFAADGSDTRMVYSGNAMVSAFACSTVIGMVFGFLPARNAARLDPIAALSHE